MNSKILALYDQLAKLSAELKVGETTEEPLGKTNLKNCISDQPENGFNMFQLLHPRKCQLSTKLVESKKLPSPQPFARLPPQSSRAMWRLRLAMWASLERKTRQWPQHRRVSAKKGL
jgi:hypothetical protein